MENATTTGIVVHSVDGADCLMAAVRKSAGQLHDWITDTAQIGDTMAMLKRMKFDPVGFHPVEEQTELGRADQPDLE